MNRYFQMILITVPFRTHEFNPTPQNVLLAKKIIQTIIVGFLKITEITILDHLEEWTKLQIVK